MKNLGGWAQEAVITPGLDGLVFPYGQQKAFRFGAHPSWVSAGDGNVDLGCIHLDVPFCSEIGVDYLEPVLEVPTELIGKNVRIAGYPTDRNVARVQYEHEGKVVHIEDGVLYYDIDTHGGQSGAPIFLNLEQGPSDEIVGLHGYGDYVGSPCPATNCGLFFTEEMLILLNNWRTQGPQ